MPIDPSVKFSSDSSVVGIWALSPAPAKVHSLAFWALVGLFLSVHHLGQLPGQNLLVAIQLAAFPAVHFIDLFHGQEGQHADAFKHVGVIHIAPILVEIIGRCFIGVQPDGVSCGFTHLLPWESVRSVMVMAWAS